MSFSNDDAVELPEKVAEALLVALAELLRAAAAEGGGEEGSQ
jgi:hypothetical protein